MLSIASYLCSKHAVDIFWPDHSITESAKRRFNLNLSNVSYVDNIFSTKYSLITRIKKSMKYDAIFYLSDGSLPLLFSRKTIIHFQFPVEWVESNSLFTKVKLAKIQKVIVNSRYTKKFIDKKFGIKSIVIYPPAMIDTKHEVFSDKENYILTIGRYNKLATGEDFKKQSILIKVFKRMIDEGLNGWKFIIVTNYKEHEKDDFEKLAASIGNYQIEIRKDVPTNEFDDLYKKAKVYWHAAGFGEDLDKHPERAEHFGIATVEAMSNGAVPVVINAGGQAEIITDGENGFLWKTESELEQKTMQLIGNEKLRQELVEQGRKKS